MASKCFERDQPELTRTFLHTSMKKRVVQSLHNKYDTGERHCLWQATLGLDGERQPSLKYRPLKEICLFSFHFDIITKKLDKVIDYQIRKL
jgi:hypothetical protein